MTYTTEQLVSPVGDIVTMAVANPFRNEKKEKEEYVIRLAFDTKKDAEWLKTVAAINKKLLVNETNYEGDTERESGQKIVNILKSGKTAREETG